MHLLYRYCINEKRPAVHAGLKAINIYPGANFYGSVTAQ